MSPKKVPTISTRRARSGAKSKSKRMKEVKKGISINRPKNPLNIQ